MNVRLKVDKHYPAAWVLRHLPLLAGTVVPVIEATNIPEKGCYWVDTEELKNDPYGILLHPGEFEEV